MKGFRSILIFISPVFITWASLFLGAYGVTPTMVIKILLNETLHIFDIGDIPEKAIIIDIRLPRVILAGLVGAALSSAGVTLQGIFRNPLVDPFILGISAGAAFGCAITIGFLSFLPLQITAFVFATVAVMVAYGVARTQGEVSRLPLILSGVIVSAFFTAMVSIVKFLVDPHKLQSIVYWLMGSFSLADWRAVKIAGAGVLAGVVPIFLMRWRLNVMSMGEEEAKALGVNIRRERLLFIGFSTFAVAVATSLCGIIGWVGLMVPHLVRMLTGPDHKSLVPLSIAAGAAFMIAADTVSRTLTTFDIPVGIITALTGAPFFIYLMKRGGKEAWGK
ncbi:FecCD family ABC transporter permease [Thermodesulfovibrio yellowstonii]|jgi:iron complex transport system permease protein|uniref:Iron(III) ABC transporter, permease protein n=1 Tax=Thermodesulfovibrio yellowstonii (strain ATCC 51303 / DSM 11347 / YP87) TaxID=289376 RepID=B5YKZ0_THEYD|nr:iron ABC transporter permease [Thermodesulfovibrio yellowstonii]ACI20870.1 iron(III) ABC transporter, permease protein [Thermodesulfovibrio yellowstonii DSM 11347]MDI6864152.1 iron ABC transporter permease [Thermodesulfovibrio yellowstonii]